MYKQILISYCFPSLLKQKFILKRVLSTFISKLCFQLCKLFFVDELKKKISESYSIFRSRVIEDLRPRDSDWSELQQLCA